MAGESITFDFVGQGADSLQRDFKGVGDNAALAAKGARLCADALAAQRKAADTSAGATLALAKADKILADAEDELAGRAALADEALRNQGDAAKKAGKDAAEASAGFGGLAGSGGIPGGGMGAAIAAGALLSPVLVTLGVGLAGFGAAAVGVAKPIENAAQASGGLAANLKALDPEQRAVAVSILGLGKQYDAFQKALQPEVLSVFNTGISVAGHLLHDVQPVAQATGKAFGSFLGQLDKEFSSGQFQQFFKFMADTAAPDMQLLGGNVTQLIGLLPALLEDLQPLAAEFLTTSDNALKLAGSIANFGKSTSQTSASVGTNVGLLGFLSKAVANVTSFMKPGGVAAGALKAGLDGIPGSAGAAGNATNALSADALSAAQHIQSLAAQVNSLTSAENKALSPLLTYTNAVLSQRNDAATLATALKASYDQVGLGSAAQRASFSAANTYIQDLLTTASAAQKSHQGIDAQISSIQNALPALQNVKGGTTQYWQEVRTLVSWLQKLQQLKTINENVHITGSGSWAFVQGGGQNQRITGPGAARGMYIGTGRPGVDDQLVMAQRGELIVPTPMVASGAVDHLRGRIPGFAAGGIVGSYGGALGGLQPWGQANWQATVSQIGTSIASAMAQQVKAAAAATSGAPGSLGGPATAGAAAAQAYARSRLGAYGWGAAQMPPLIALWNGESGWNRLAKNPSSGAYGIPQALPGSKMGPDANPPKSSAAAQINWGMGYIERTPGYGSPSVTYAKWLARSPHWYDQGGILPPGLTLAANATGKPEHVIPGEGIAGILDELTGILAAIEALTGTVSGTSGGSILGGPGVGNSTSVVSPAGGGFGLTRSDLGLPPPSTGDSSATADTSGSTDGSGGTAAAPAKPKAKPKPDPAKNAAIKVLTSLLTGDITHNRLAAAQQANSLLDWLGVTSHDKTVRQVANLDRLLAQYRKSKNSRAVAATEQLLRSFGVHDFSPELTVKGNPAKSAVISRIERMIKTDIGANNLGAARQDNAILSPLGAHKYTSVLSQIAMFDQLLTKYKKAKDSKDIKATEQILRTYGVKKFAAGGWITEPVTGIGASGQVYQFGEAGRPELVVPSPGRGGSAAGSDLGGRLDRLIALHEQLIRTTAAVPAATGRHVAAGVNGAAADAVFRGRYPGR